MQIYKSSNSQALGSTQQNKMANTMATIRYLYSFWIVLLISNIKLVPAVTWAHPSQP